MCLFCSTGWDRGKKTVSGRHGLSGTGKAVHKHHQHGDITGKQTVYMLLSSNHSLHYAVLGLKKKKNSILVPQAIMTYNLLDTTLSCTDAVRKPCFILHKYQINISLPSRKSENWRCWIRPAFPRRMLGHLRGGWRADSKQLERDRSREHRLLLTGHVFIGSFEL